MILGISCLAALFLLVDLTSGQQTPLITPIDQSVQVVNTVAVGTEITNLTIANVIPEPDVFISDFTTESFVTLTGSQSLISVRLNKSLRFEKAPSTQELYVVAALNGYSTTATITLYITKPVSVILPALNTTGLIPNPQNVETVASNLAIFTQSLCDVYSKQTPTTAGLTRFRLFCLLFETVYKNLPPTIFPDDPENNACNATMPCLNGGSCYAAQNGTKICQCQDGTYGRRCEYGTIDCRSNPCKNGASCLRANNGSYQCYCGQEFYGTYCEFRNSTSVCNSTSPCANGGSCLKLSNGTNRCFCRPENYGLRCEHRNFTGSCSDTVPCYNGGTCIRAATTRCVCGEGYLGPRCEYRNETCNSITCMNGGTCVVGLYGTVGCLCLYGFDGRQCETRNSYQNCFNSPCQNGGTCVQRQDGNSSCSCDKGFYGPECQFRDSTANCLSSPCQNNGRCVLMNGEYSCQCNYSYTGSFCQYARISDNCTLTPCLNGGACIIDLSGNTSCECRIGYFGDRCEYRPDTSGTGPCSVPRCQNGGTCGTRGAGQFVCSCPLGYNGTQCENDVSLSFQSSTISLVVSELNAAGIRVGTIFVDDLFDGTAPLTITSNDTQDLIGFEVLTTRSLRKGWFVTLRRSLDRELNSTHWFKIRVTDGKRVASATLVLHLNDVNDNPPRFPSSSYTVAVQSDAIPFTQLLTLNATDADTGENSKITYRILESSNGKSRFKLERDTGVFMTNDSLENFGGQQINLVVTAQDNGQVSMTATASVTINVLQGDGKLKFDRNRLILNVVENSPPGSALTYIAVGPVYSNRRLTVRTNDTNGIIGFNITQTTNLAFVNLFVNATLNRERNSTYYFLINVTDGLSMATATGVVNVLDVNDNPPKFENGRPIIRLSRLAGPTAVIGRVSAFDPDAGSNGTITYEIIAGDMYSDVFNISKRTGSIGLEGYVAYYPENITFVVRATDGGNRQSIVNVTVFIRYLDDPCSSNPCSNNSECYLVSLGYSCRCKQQFTGINCETKKVCTFNPCENGGSCVIDSAGNTQCLCQSGYSGNNCQNAPSLRFRERNMTFTVPENRWGTVLGPLQVDDLLQPSVGQVFIRSNDSILRFERFDTSATASWRMSIQRIPDREVQSLHIIQLTASLGNKSINTSLVLHISDINDNSPVFNKTQYSVVLNNDLVRGTVVTTVSATDRDAGRNGTISYSITGGSIERNRFAINNRTGAITLTSSLFTMVGRQIQMTVTARDGGNPSLSNTTSVSVRVQQGNGRLKFASQRTVLDVSENTIIGTPLLELSVGPIFSGRTVSITYNETGIVGEGVSTNDNQALVILRLAKELDRETNDQIGVVIIASDGIDQANTTLILNVTDVNDNAPIFPSAESEVQINKNAQIGTNVTRVNAIDNDAGENGTVTYQIMGGSQGFDIFALNNRTGYVTVNGSLSSLTVNVVTVVIMAMDDGSPRRTGVMRLSVNVTSGTSPRALTFSPRIYAATIAAPLVRDSIITSVLLLDADLQYNGSYVSFYDPTGTVFANRQFIYGTQNSIPVRLNTTSITENQRIVNLIARVMNTGLQINCTIILTIAGASTNIFAPVFQNTSYSVNISVMQGTDSPFLVVGAIDRDSGINGLIRYSMTRGNRTFSINSLTGAVYAKTRLFAFDGTIQNITILATDGGQPPKVAAVNVTIQIGQQRDTTNSEPFFAQQSYFFTVLENQPNGTFLGNLVATDIDGGSTVSIRLLSSYPGIFRVGQPTTSGNQKNVALFTNAILDRENIDNYIFQAAASDSISTATVRVTIQIRDVNDNRPVFSEREYTSDVPVNTAMFTTVVTPQVLDSDIGNNGEVTFRKQVSANPDYSGPFIVNQQSGIVVIGGELNGLEGRVVEFDIVATDKGTPALMATVSIKINVTGIAANLPPQFINLPETIAVNENMPMATRIMMITLRDNDGPVPPFLSFQDRASFDTVEITPFDRNATHAMYALERKAFLDREKASVKIIKLTASDGFDSTNRTIRLFINDVNDNAPRFSLRSYSATISRGTAIGETVRTVLANDPDQGRNGQVVYSIQTTQAPGVFMIDPDSGDIKVASSLVGWTDRTINLRVEARDMGTPVLNASVAVAIKVERGPVITPPNTGPNFTADSYSLNISENTLGKILELRVIDTDGPQGVTFRVAGASATEENKEIEIVHRSELSTTMWAVYIRTVRRFDRELSPKYEALVIASDSQSETTATVTINVEDINDNSPVFSQSQYTQTISSDTQVDTQILQVRATDADAGSFGRVTYSLSIQTGQDAFRIDENGNIFLTRSLAELGVNQFSLTVTAMDFGRRSSTANVVIDISSPQ